MGNTEGKQQDKKPNKKDSEIFINGAQWKVMEIIGQGSFGDVYRLERGRSNLSMKVVNKNDLLTQASSNDIQLIVDEANLLKQLNRSPYVIQLYATLKIQKELLIITEYLELGSLYEYIDIDNPLGVEVARHVAHDIIRALHYVHSSGHVHRDVKPENILIRKDLTFVLCDFNCATSLKAGARLTGFAGCFDYMSPEMLTDSSHDFKTDMWSLGVVLYEVIAGSSPWVCMIKEVNEEFKRTLNPDILNIKEVRDNPFMVAKMYHIIHGEIRQPSSNDLSKEILVDLLSRNPDTRYSSFFCLNHQWVQQLKPRNFILPLRLPIEYFKRKQTKAVQPISIQDDAAKIFSRFSNWTNE